MADLHLTPTRRELVEACYEGRVLEGLEDNHTWLVEIGYENRKVDARIAELERAGYVALGTSQMFWDVTEAGRKAMGWDP